MRIAVCFALSTLLLFPGISQAEELGPNPSALSASKAKAIAFLRASQDEGGSWTDAKYVGITGVVTLSLLDIELPPEDPTVAKALTYLEGFAQKDGGIYHPDSSHRNYETAIAVMAFAKANRNGKYDGLIRGAERFMKELQWDEGEGITSDDPYYGGAGYGSHKRPDLSNTQFFIEALREAGVSNEDPAMQKALTFVSRTQNLATKYNNTEFADKIGDGGFYYTPANGGESKAGETPEGGLRSYASMTYAGLKSMIYASLTQEDPRVTAAYEWIQKNYTVTENPGVGQQGLYYYYQVFAKTLELMSVDYVVTEDGKKHDWRKDLGNQLIEAQRSEGSWTNETDRWYEGDPNLVTAYSLLALDRCAAPEKE
ncbi:prenyltransferase/squalene oxidase repeat-containing protein [Calycomorphotria hydatis]|uniref:Squalene cyclase C-terminal domain-containing protein n=1 Tax=Calycomorphotria hydatis TaxID=2528027 RepID=A0A517T4B4_9PLAN|nr:prenyltransferase/squalene oxidase repeat-containing protein [Calycomorphotria hydatis]QDT63208.1 hypothetical protein V22_04260 [Calycomorphotria hydatis]